MTDKFDQLYEKTKQRLDDKCWKGYRKQGTKKKGDTIVNNCVKIKESNKKKKKKNPKGKVYDPRSGTYYTPRKMPKESAKQLEEKNARCTKATKKASSTSKGKKWMKCVKSDSGGYKRIHWGQKGVKVSGKANTKRRKSFRARHKCSTAKANTPRGQACKDW